MGTRKVKDDREAGPPITVKLSRDEYRHGLRRALYNLNRRRVEEHLEAARRELGNLVMLIDVLGDSESLAMCDEVQELLDRARTSLAMVRGEMG